MIFLKFVTVMWQHFCWTATFVTYVRDQIVHKKWPAHKRCQHTRSFHSQFIVRWKRQFSNVSWGDC